MLCQLTLDRTGPTPLYLQLARFFEELIARGELVPGERIDTEVVIAQTLGLSRPTVARAINELVDKGLLLRRRGFGTEVSNAVEHREVELTSLFEDLVRNGRKPRTQVLAIECDVRNPKAALLLGLDSDCPLVHLKRLRLAENQPIAVMDNWLPMSFADLTQAQLTEDGLYGVLRARGSGPAMARQQIGAKAAGVEEARLLQVRRGTPLMTMMSRAYDASGAVVECGRHVYRADVYSIEVMVQSDRT
ncbi:GntR family transcriptional regulator [Nakamurella antarctica]|uniref:GntR family transcriptional regulator n=1 Tax=Nakamurella antarctica TaxID=1902245 RepID=A0A3G8ZU77_9ACTN|nr:GntR family transcriptional regulator [Nakamurella antarctica]AZI57341.1 GntR family transcriptional regulator [Nakamurella antarctica]